MNDEIDNIGDTPDWFRQAMAQPREDLEITIDGTPTSYFRWGNPDKPPIIFVHGFLSHRRCWAMIAPLLAEKYDLYSFDLAGMGDSGTAAGYDLEDRLEQVVAFTRALKLKQKPFFVGHSFGGGLFIQTLKEYPDLARGLIACDVFMLAPDAIEAWMGREDRRPTGNTGKKRIYPDWETIYGRFVLSPPQPVGCPFLFEYMAKHSVKQVADGWTWKFDPNIINRNEKELMWWVDNLPAFAALKLPKAIIHGAKSELVKGNTLSYLREADPSGFPVHALPDAGHHLMLDKPLELAQAIDEVIASWL